VSLEMGRHVAGTIIDEMKNAYKTLAGKLEERGPYT
jgi:hypothetical protein